MKTTNWREMTPAERKIMKVLNVAMAVAIGVGLACGLMLWGLTA